MQAPEIPENEAERLQTLRELCVLDTESEERFDALTRVAQALFQVPIALVSLVDADRQWFKSRQGLDVSETPRRISFCGHTILTPDVMLIADTLDDTRFADNPLVTAAPDIRFYAGAPLVMPNGHRIGTLCLIDRRPRAMTPDDVARLKDLASSVVREFNRGRLLASQEALRASEANLQAVLNTAVDGIITIDEMGIIQTVNPAARRIFGYEAAAMVGQNVRMLMPPPYHDAHDGYLDNYRRTRDPKIIGIGRQVVGRRSDGTIFPLELAVAEMQGDGPRHFVGTVRDVSERIRMEQMKSEFVSTVSHELRTPLTSIRGSLGLVMGRFGEQLPAKARRLLEMAERNSVRLTVLINDLLDLEKIESGRLAFTFEEVDLRQIVERAVEANEGFAGKHGVSLAFSTTLTEAPVMADPSRLAQVMANLLSNAAKFSPAGAEVSVRLACQRGELCVTVIDRGSGIPAAFQDRIFQRFAQADSSDTRSAGGTGLGLSISKAIVERHEGAIGYDTTEGVGTAFHFTLPVWRGAGPRDRDVRRASASPASAEAEGVCSRAQEEVK